MRTFVAASTLAIALAATAAATTVPFTESFTADAANWRNGAGTATATWSGTGGADGAGFISDTFSFANSVENDTPILLRGQSNFGSSGGALFGNWITDGVTEYRVSIKHDAPVPLNFFTRFASPAGFPGAIGLGFAPILPNTWTELVIPINPANPQFISFEGADFNTVFSNVGRVQVGVSVPAALAGNPNTFTFDVDEVTLLPEPTTLTAIALAGLALLRRRG